MKPTRYNTRNGSVTIALTLLALLALSVAGCARNTGIQILPMGNQHILTLTADGVVEVMRAAGFSDMQIWEHGTALRDGLARSGAVQIKIGDTAEAIFAIRGDSVYITTRLRGNFIYNVNTGWVQGG